MTIAIPHSFVFIFVLCDVTGWYRFAWLSNVTLVHPSCKINIFNILRSNLVLVNKFIQCEVIHFTRKMHWNECRSIKIYVRHCLYNSKGSYYIYKKSLHTIRSRLRLIWNLIRVCYFMAVFVHTYVPIEVFETFNCQFELSLEAFRLLGESFFALQLPPVRGDEPFPVWFRITHQSWQ